MKTRLLIFVLLLTFISCINPKQKRDEANRLLQKEQFKEALIAINKAIKFEPDSINNYLIRVLIYDAIGKYEEEIIDLTKIIELNKSSKLLLAYHQRAITHIQLENYDKALTDIDYFIENIDLDTSSNLAEAYLNKASILYNLNETQKAKVFYELTLKENNKKDKIIESQALVGLANLSKSHKEELILLNKAIEIDNNNAQAFGNRAALYLEVLGKADEAFFDLKKAISINPKDATLSFNMGQLLLNYTGQLDSAVLYFKKAIKLAPQSPMNGLIYMNLAVISHNLGNLNQSLNEFQTAESMIPDNDLMFFNYAMLLSDLNRENDALQKINKAIEVNPSDPSYYNLKGSILLGLSSYKEAELAFLDAIKLDSKFGGAYYNLGYLFGVLSDHNKSIEYYDKAVNLDFDLESTLVNRALEKIKINRTTDACKDLKKAYNLGRVDIKPLIDKYCRL